MRTSKHLLFLATLCTLALHCRKSGPTEVFILEPTNIDSIRDQIHDYKESHPINETSKGWAIPNSRDPMAILGFFPSIGVRPDYRLAMYQWQDSLGGFAGIYATRSDRALPKPATNSMSANPDANIMAPDLIAGNPAPELGGSWFSFMNCITGNDSPQSYFLASVFMFEARELGAEWHGKFWSNEFILEGKPEDHRYTTHGIIKPTEKVKDLKKQLGRINNTVPYPIHWNYTHPWPQSWHPYVVFTKENVQVKFVTYTARDECQLRLNTLNFKRGSYVPTNISSERLAKGDGSFFQY